jgi:hypothetical protein
VSSLQARLASRDALMPRRCSTSSSIHRKPHHSDSEREDDDDALLEELEDDLDNDFELGGFRERRMMELKAAFVSRPSPPSR